MLLISGGCWGAFLLLVIGAFLRHFRLLKVTGIVIQVIAFLFYLLGLRALSCCFMTPMIGKEG